MGRKPVWSVQTPEYDALIKFVATKREEAGVSQRRLSQMMGQSSNYIKFIEDGSRRLDLIEFLAIMQQLGCDPKKSLIALIEDLAQ